MAKRTYKLDDSSVVTVPEALKKFFDIWGVPCSDTLIRQRLTYSTDPEYIYSEKGLIVGHKYCKVAKKRKKAPKIKKKKFNDHTRFKTGELKPYYDPLHILAMAGVTKRYLKLTAKT